MRTGGTRISRAHNLAQQNERWIGEVVFFQNRIERNIFAVMPKLAIRHVEHDSVVDFCPVSVVRQEDKLRVSINEFFDEPWTGNSIHFNFLASDPFHALDFVRGSLVLVCSRCCCALWRASNLYSTSSRTHWRGSRRFHCRSQCCSIDLDLSRNFVVQRAVEPKIHRSWVQLFVSHRNLRRSGHNRVFSSFPAWWSTVGCSRDFSRWGGHHGDRGHCVFPRSTILAEDHRRRVCHHRFVFAAQIEIHSVFTSSEAAIRYKPSPSYRRQCRVRRRTAG